MKYIELINGLIKEKSLETDNIVLYGENISAGSCLSGLSRGLKVKKGNLIINTPNSENCQVGLGFGLMMNSVNSIFFFKQHDFLLLGIDHLVNTYNFIRRDNPKASFTIVFVIVDNGYQGLQSSLNNFSDLCSIARIPGYTLNSKSDIEEILGKHLVKPGFRMIGISQRMFKDDLIEDNAIYKNEGSNMFQYDEGDKATIVCFNLSLTYGVELQKRIKEKGFSASLFSVNSPTPIEWDKIIKDAEKTGKIIIIDDSKSVNLPCYNLLMNIKDSVKRITLTRDLKNDWLSPNLDQLEIDYGDIIKRLIE